MEDIGGDNGEEEEEGNIFLNTRAKPGTKLVKI